MPVSPPSSSLTPLHPAADRLAVIWAFIVFPLAAMISNRGHLAILAIGLSLVVVLDRVRGGDGWRAVQAAWRPWRWRPVALAAFAFATLAVLSALWNAVPALSLSRGATLVAVILVAVAWSLLLRSTDTTRLWRPALLGLCAIVLFIGEEVYGPGWFIAWRGTTEPSLNRSFVTASLWLWPVIALALMRGTLWRAGALWLVTALVIAGSTSQSALLGLIVGAGALLIALAAPRLAVGAYCLGTSALMAATPFMIPSLKRSLDGGALDRLANWSAGIRLDIWDAYARTVPERPWFGWGADAGKNFGRDGIAIQPQNLTPIMPQHHPHNAFLQAWVDMGLVGAGLAVLIMVLMALAILKLKPIVQAPALAALSAYTVIGFVSHGLWQSWWLMLGAMLAAVFAALGRTD